MPLGPGQTLSHYRIERLIGQGGMGAVFLAVDTTLDRKVALKVLPLELASSADRLERFRREAKAVAALNHPHIVTIHTVEEDGGTHFLTMELVDGDSLDQTIPPTGLPLAKVFDVGIALADALAAAHEKGIIHRDLKPANVIVAQDGRVKVLDFGLAKLAPGSPGIGPEPGGPDASEAPTQLAPARRALTDAGLVVGTVPYMSPEQVNGRAVDARTDIFSLGVVLYEMATGRRPFSGNTPAETISSILRDAPRPVTESRGDAPRHLARIIDHCLQKDPEARFQTAKDVRNELRALRKEVESGASAATGLVATPPGTVMSQSTSAGSSAVSTPSGPLAGAAGSRPWVWMAAGAAVVLAVIASFWLGGRRGDEPGLAGATAGGAGAASPAPVAVDVTAKNSVAVLPFANLSADKDQEYFSDGLTEELLNALAKIPELKVTGRTSSFSFKGRNDDLRTIGEKLGVANLLEGSVRKSGNRVRITAQLVKAADGFHLWSETYDRTLDDIFAVQDDIARSVAQALQVTLLGKGPGARPANAEAYDLILRARSVMQINTDESLRRAREMLERALDLSPEYAPAWAEMGLLHIRETEKATTVDARQEARERGRKALAKALELDPGLAAALSRIAGIQTASWDFAAAQRSTERALAADPKSILVSGNAAVLYGNLGRFDEAVALHERTHEAEPLYLPGFSNLAFAYWAVGRLDDAEAVCHKAIDLRPEFEAVHQALGYVHLQRGDAEKARSSLTRFNELAGLGDYGRLVTDALVEHTAGHEQASRNAAEEFERRFGADDPMSCAEIRAWRGETDAAFAWIDKGVAARDPALAQLKIDVFLRSLHSDPRWDALLGKIGLPTD